MKINKVVLLIAFVLLFAALLVNCFGSTVQLHLALWEYSNISAASMPEDLHLTIYFVDPNLLTRYPWSVDDLVNSDVVKIVDVSNNQIVGCSHVLEKLDVSDLLPANENTYLNARLYYVFETDYGKLLDVAISNIGGNAFVNGVEAEHSPAFYEVIAPFLSEEDLDLLGI